MSWTRLPSLDNIFLQLHSIYLQPFLYERCIETVNLFMDPI